MMTAYRALTPAVGKILLRVLIHDLTKKLPGNLVEVKSLATTLTKRASDILAHFDHLGLSIEPTEATNVRLEHLRGSALGFRNLTTNVAVPCWSLLVSGRYNTLDCVAVKPEAAGFSIVAEARGCVVFPRPSAGADYSESTATSRYETWIGPFVVDPDR